MASSTTRLTTFAEFEQLPEPPFGRYELRHGEPVLVPPPKYGHHLIQRRLRRLLEAAVGGAGDVDSEMGFRIRDHEYRIADVAFLSKDRANGTRLEGYIEGAPELVIEVLSPSNTAAEIRDKRKLCLEHGCREFWVVDPDLAEVEVSTPDGRAVTYKSGQAVPLIFGGDLTVDSIFAPSA